MHMSDIRALLDPDHTLPSIELKTNRVQGYGDLLREDEQVYLDGEVVGDCTIVTQSNPEGPKVHFDGIAIYQDQRGRGIGLATYLAAIERAQKRGFPFETQDATQTGNAKRIWELLAQKGVAEVIEPFKPIRGREDRYEGKYRVPATK